MILPENILRLMSSADRRRYAGGQLTNEEAYVKASRRAEKEEHNLFINWLGLHGLQFRHDRMDKKTSGTVGWPDFTIVVGGRCLLGDFKVYGNKLSSEQKERFGALSRTGTEVEIWSSADQAIRKTRNWLWEHFQLEWANSELEQTAAKNG
jgi:hypothetical protein